MPNSADVDNGTSLRIAALVLDHLGQQNPNRTGKSDPPPPGNPGQLLEVQVAADAANELPRLSPLRAWEVRRGARIIEYAQYRHLDELNKVIAKDPNLRVTLGTDYLIKPDVLVGLRAGPESVDLRLHAAISCKWTIRSDRVQNIRHENSIMIRHRRGRLPHLVTVTAEPLPTRLASIARGTGEVDATYHIAYREMEAAVAEAGTSEQKDAWAEITGQGRVLDYSSLAETLAFW
ncbi:NgoMIV family type II restriction endonuclease [Nocardia asteroides]|uniref:NgoMIV family type II restriction endonuclease n=1 Tax=Nocardia asteroides TaxID=1824 RepID=UPI001E3BC717|nr:NgoMIV family type II restriction endonuclease [Nocardia asteroides]UGT63780.1 restriction endonuclease [Nocardia asteroides]